MRFEPVLPMDGIDFYVTVVPFDRVPENTIKKRPHAVLLDNRDGTYSLLIDANAVYEEQLRVYWHEYEHMVYEDFTNGKNIREVENSS